MESLYNNRRKSIEIRNRNGKRERLKYNVKKRGRASTVSTPGGPGAVGADAPGSFIRSGVLFNSRSNYHLSTSVSSTL